MMAKSLLEKIQNPELEYYKCLSIKYYIYMFKKYGKDLSFFSLKCFGYIGLNKESRINFL